MPKWLRYLLVIYVPVIVSGVVWYFSEVQTNKRIFNSLNAELNEATKEKNIKSLNDFLQKHLAGNAVVKISVEQIIMGLKSNSMIMKQDFNKADFLRFVGLTLESVDSYSLTTTIQKIDQGDDGINQISTTAVGSAEAVESMAGQRLPMRYSLQMRCESKASIMNDEAIINEMNCAIGLGQRPGSASSKDMIDIMNRATGVTN